MGKASRNKREQDQNGQAEFFDPAKDTPAELGPKAADEYTRLMVEGLAAAGVQPEFIYAFKKTGFVLTPENEHLLSADERRAWDDAVAEYLAQGGNPVN